jgi:glyceraldehyde-3-phosphate dehydrogenase (NADP+)
MRIYSEEQFGPIIPVVSYEKIEEPVKYTLDSNFGQQMSVFGTNVRPISVLLSSVKSQVSRININAKCQRGPDTFPFTGRKDSAKGDFSTSEILNLFSARSTITARENEWSEWLFKAFRKQ